MSMPTREAPRSRELQTLSPSPMKASVSPRSFPLVSLMVKRSRDDLGGVLEVAEPVHYRRPREPRQVAQRLMANIPFPL